MVKKDEVMVGDIVRLKNWAFEVLEIQTNSVVGRLLTVGVGSFVEAWPKVMGYEITEDLLEALGYHHEEGYREDVMVYREFWNERDRGYVLTYQFDDHSFALLNHPTKQHGFCYAYATYLHELMHLYRAFRIDCSGMYKRMRDYKVPTELL